MTDQKSLDDLMAEFSALENSVPTKKTPTTSPDKKIDVKKKDTETDDLLAEFAALEDSIKKQDAKPKVQAKKDTSADDLLAEFAALESSVKPV